MSKQKIFTLIFFAILIASTALLLNASFALNSLLTNNALTETFASEYSQLQKNAGIMGIVSFILLLIVGLILYYLTSKPTYILFSNIIYIVLVLNVFVSVNRQYFVVQNIDHAQNSEYWLTVFMGIFYILGAVLVSTIGYITIRNYSKRTSRL